MVINNNNICLKSNIQTSSVDEFGTLCGCGGCCGCDACTIVCVACVSAERV